MKETQTQVSCVASVGASDKFHCSMIILFLCPLTCETIVFIHAAQVRNVS